LKGRYISFLSTRKVVAFFLFCCL